MDYDDAQREDIRRTHLQKHNPKLYRALVKRGELADHLRKRVAMFHAEVARIVEAGIAGEAQARQWAERSVLRDLLWD